jgi:uncharacterized membrane protein
MLIDLVCFSIAALLLVIYHWLVFGRATTGKQTFIQFQDEIRRDWVAAVMLPKEAILGVQTLRNSIMGATVFSTTSILLIIGTLTLSVQMGKLGEASRFFASGEIEQSLLKLKTLCLLANLLCAFMFFAQAIRLYAHIGIIIGTASNENAQHAATRLMNQAARCHFGGMRCYYLAVPLVLWLYDPYLLVVSTVVMLPILLKLDRSPVATN